MLRGGEIFWDTCIQIWLPLVSLFHCWGQAYSKPKAGKLALVSISVGRKPMACLPAMVSVSVGVLGQAYGTPLCVASPRQVFGRLCFLSVLECSRQVYCTLPMGFVWGCRAARFVSLLGKYVGEGGA